jgi:ATP-binding cassette subfamily F protein 3
VSGSSRKEQKRQEAETRQARSRERKAQQGAVSRLEREIQGLEARNTELVMELEKPETYDESGRAMEVNRELSEIQKRLAGVTSQWEAEATRLAAMEAAEA